MMEDPNHNDDRLKPPGKSTAEQMKRVAGLKPKGACWYCNQPLDNVRRFCNKTCADDYLTEEEAFRDVLK
jgi:hypothetical protein